MPDSPRIRRRSPRRRARLRVATTRGSWFTANVSAGGFCTHLMRVLPVEQHLEGSIRLGGIDRFFSGRVAWSTAGDTRLAQLGRMGVCFVQVDPELARALATSEGKAAGASM